MFLSSSDRINYRTLKSISFWTWKFCAYMNVFERIMEQGLETCIIKTRFNLTDLGQLLFAVKVSTKDTRKKASSCFLSIWLVNQDEWGAGRSGNTGEKHDKTERNTARKFFQLQNKLESREELVLFQKESKFELKINNNSFEYWQVLQLVLYFCQLPPAGFTVGDYSF